VRRVELQPTCIAVTRVWRSKRRKREGVLRHTHDVCMRNVRVGACQLCVR
jgi:hypothetical protein